MLETATCVSSASFFTIASKVKTQSPKTWFYWPQWKSFKMKALQWFNFILKCLFVFKMFKILSGFFGHIGKWLDKKVNVNLKLNEVINWETNYNTYIVKHLKKLKQSEKEILSVNRI